MPALIGLNSDETGLRFYVNGAVALHLVPASSPVAKARRELKILDPEIFPNAVSRLHRASKLLEEMAETLSTYWSQAEFKLDQGIDPRSGKYVIRVQLMRELPSELATIVGDILNNLRGALNMLVMDMVRDAGHETNKQHQFPTSESREKYYKEAPKRLSNISYSGRRFVDCLRPYKGGNDMLWELSRLRNTREHDIVVPVVFADLRIRMRAGLRNMLRALDGSVTIMGGPPGSQPLGYEHGEMTPIDSQEVKLLKRRPTVLYQGSADIAYLQFDTRLHLTINIGPDAGSLDVLYDFQTLVNRIVAIAQTKLA